MSYRPARIHPRIRINTLAVAARLPTMHSVREYVEAGGLMSMEQTTRTCSGAPPTLSKRFCRGEPADIPVRAADQIRFVVDLTLARAPRASKSTDGARTRRRR